MVGSLTPNTALTWVRVREAGLVGPWSLPRLTRCARCGVDLPAVHPWMLAGLTPMRAASWVGVSPVCWQMVPIAVARPAGPSAARSQSTWTPWWCEVAGSACWVATAPRRNRRSVRGWVAPVSHCCQASAVTPTRPASVRAGWLLRVRSWRMVMATPSRSRVARARSTATPSGTVSLMGVMGVVGAGWSWGWPMLGARWQGGHGSGVVGAVGLVGGGGEGGEVSRDLVVQPQPGCDAVDVVEVGAHVVGVHDRQVVQPDLAERLDVSLGHRAGVASELVGVAGHGRVGGRQVLIAALVQVVDEVVGDAGVGELEADLGGAVGGAVAHRGDVGDDEPLPLGERRRAAFACAIQVHAGGDQVGVEAAEQAEVAGVAEGGGLTLVGVGEQAGRLGLRDGRDPHHDRLSPLRACGRAQVACSAPAPTSGQTCWASSRRPSRGSGPSTCQASAPSSPAWA